jgi:glycolate oxidase FAD binding subunit
MKNVTGYDLSKLLAGSWGTLAVLDQVSVKVLPAPDQTRTLLLLGLDDAAAVKAMCAAMGSPHEVSGAAHLPGRTALRVEGVAPSVDARLKGLRELLASTSSRMEELGTLESRVFWREVRDVAPLQAATGDIVWKISCPPTDGPRVVAQIKGERPDVRYFYDWSGGLVWLALPQGADADHSLVRAGLAGHATLVRAPEAVRAAVPVFHPQSPALAALAKRVKESFDPKGLFNPGRMG